jgi:oxygen tolerance protein BatD
MNLPRLLCACALAMAVLPRAFAQEVEVRASAEPNRVEEGGEVQFSIQILGGSQEPDEPPNLSQLPGFVVATGPMKSSYFQWVNGQTTSSRTYTWTLLPQGRGLHTIPSISVSLGGKTYRTPVVRVDVVDTATGGGAGGAPPAGSNPPSTFSDPSTRRRLAAPPDTPASLFVEAWVDKTQAYPGEQISLVYKVYTQYEIVQMTLNDQPTYQGFWVEDIKSDDKYEARAVTRKEGNFTEYSVLKKALFPTSPGSLTIPPLTFRFVVRKRGADAFDSFFFNPTESVFRSSKEVRVQVKELPEQGRPPEFNGAVGRFTLSASADRTDTKVNDAVGLKVEVEGQGNINTLGNPTLPPLPDFKRYDPKVEEEVQAHSGTLVGSKTWNYVLIPLAPGSQEIPPVRFAFFDPQTARYRVLESEPIHLSVARGEAGDLPVPSLPSRADIPVLGSDIRYIHLGGEGLVDQGQTLYGSPLLVAGLAAPILFNIGLLAFLHRREKLAGTEALVRQRRARRTARRRLARAQGRLSKERSRDFYQELASALTTYLADKIGVPASGLTYDRIEEVLELRGVEPGLRGQFRRCLETCDFARFAPAASEPAEMEKAFAEAESVVESLEGSVKPS